MHHLCVTANLKVLCDDAIAVTGASNSARHVGIIEIRVS